MPATKLPKLIVLAAIVDRLDAKQIRSLIAADQAAQYPRGIAWEAADNLTFAKHDPRYNEIQAIRKVAIERAQRAGADADGGWVSVVNRVEDVALACLIAENGDTLPPEQLENLVGTWRAAGLPLR
jgi:hypothetical protein